MDNIDDNTLILILPPEQNAAIGRLVDDFSQNHTEVVIRIFAGIIKHVVAESSREHVIPGEKAFNLTRNIKVNRANTDSGVMIQASPDWILTLHQAAGLFLVADLPQASHTAAAIRLMIWATDRYEEFYNGYYE